MAIRVLLFLLLLLPASASAQGLHTCIYVIDGDTIAIDLNGKEERVRLIGIDTPEFKETPQFFAEEAYAFTRRMAEGKRVRLEYGTDRRDKYGRLLAYVYLENNTFLNAEIVKQGYGKAFTKYPFKYSKEFKGYQNEAKRHKKGMWRRGGLMLPPRKR